MLMNVRMPEQNRGDLKAQIAAMATGERKIHAMIARFGIDTFREGIQDLLDYGENQARRLIERIPDGEYFFADYMAAADSHHGFGFSEARKAFERVWTRENYEVLTAILAREPVDWRFFVKHRVFETIERIPVDERTGMGEEVRWAFAVLAAEYPDLAEHAAN